MDLTFRDPSTISLHISFFDLGFILVQNLLTGFRRAVGPAEYNTILLSGHALYKATDGKSKDGWIEGWLDSRARHAAASGWIGPALSGNLGRSF